MLGFKWFEIAAIAIAGIESRRQICEGQFEFGGLRLKDVGAPASGMQCWKRAKGQRQTLASVA